MSESGIIEASNSTSEARELEQRKLLNVRVSRIHRASYESKSLRYLQSAELRVMKCIEDTDTTTEQLCQLIKALDTIIERKRVLFQMPLATKAGVIGKPLAINLLPQPLLEAEILSSGSQLAEEREKPSNETSVLKCKKPGCLRAPVWKDKELWECYYCNEHVTGYGTATDVEEMKG